MTITGVIGFQITWINNSYKIWDDQFDADVRESLTTAVEKGLQRKFVEYTTTVNIPGLSNLNVLSIDSLFDSKSFYFELDDHEIISKQSFGDIQEIIAKADSFTMEFNTDSLLDKTYNHLHKVIDIKDSLELNIKSDLVISKSDDLEESDPIERMEYKIVVNNVVDSFIKTYMYSTEESEDDSYSEFVDRLKKELILRNIDIEFNVGVYNFEDSKFDYLFPDYTDTSSFENAYKVPLFEKLHSPDYASIYFPNKNSYLLQQMWPSILGSLILIIITIFSFWFILSTIYRQKQLSEIKSDFINNMTHELKTPITTVSLAIEAMKDFNILESKEQTWKYLDIAESENKRLALLVDRILKVAAYQREDIKLNLENVELHKAISDVIKNIEVQIVKKNGSITKKFSPEEAIINVDKVHFNNMIYNLLDNAIKYSVLKPEIIVSTKIEKSGFTIRIADNGIGISKQYQEKVFDKFYRVSTGDIHEVKGHGLGLSYVKDIVEMHEGRISLSSEIGNGSTFSVFIPRQI